MRISAGRVLVNTNFRAANLSDALFRNVAATHLNLCESLLVGTDLEWARISADLRGAILEDTMLYGATFSFSNLSGVDLRKTRGLPDMSVNGAGVKTEGTDHARQVAGRCEQQPSRVERQVAILAPPRGTTDQRSSGRLGDIIFVSDSAFALVHVAQNHLNARAYQMSWADECQFNAHAANASIQRILGGIATSPSSALPVRDAICPLSPS